MMKGIGGDKNKEIFGQDYPDNIWSWSELMRRLFGNADIVRNSSESLPIQPKPTLLKGDIIAPAIAQVRMLLRERGFSPFGIRYGNFWQIPALDIDPDQFQQVFFNMLSNAIKYCEDDPNEFKVTITGAKVGNEYVIWFRDDGPGIQEGMEEVIFEEGVRGPDAAKKDVTGQGFGLWVVRRIVNAHGGRVQVTGSRKPTEFTIYLPTSLKAE